MPRQFHSSRSGNISASTKRKEKNQKNETRNAFEDEEAIVGKTMKCLGNKWFSVAINKDTELKIRIRGKGKNIPYINVGDYVILSKDISGGHIIYEIVCPIDNKDIKAFKKRMSSSLMEAEEDDLFIRPEPEKEEDDEIDFTNI